MGRDFNLVPKCNNGPPCLLLIFGYLPFGHHTPNDNTATEQRTPSCKYWLLVSWIPNHRHIIATRR